MLHFVVAVVSLLLLTSIAAAHHRPGHGGPSGSPPPTEPLQVYDFFEQRLGQYTSQGCFIRQIEGHWVEVCGFDANGHHDPTIYFLLYSESECQGQAYLSTFWEETTEDRSIVGNFHFFTGQPMVFVSRRGFLFSEGGPLVFAADPIDWVRVKSFQDPLINGFDCIELPETHDWETPAGRAISVNIDDWVPPFSIR